MTNRYVRSTDGSDADNGLTWATAKATVAGAIATPVVAGDTIYVSQSHAETTAGALSWGTAGTVASPTRILCGNDGAEPPTALATTATITTTGASAISMSGVCYVYGLTFNSSDGANVPQVTTSGSRVRLDTCVLNLVGTSSTGVLGNGSGTAWLDLINCNIKLSNAGQGFRGNGRLYWNGGGVVSGSSTPTNLITAYNLGGATSGVEFLIENVDFSNFGAATNFSIPVPAGAVLRIRNCKLPASWSGALVSSAFTTPGRAEMFNCDSGATNYKIKIQDNGGNIDQETLIVRTGGASDGTTPISWKMVSAANCNYPHITLATPNMVLWNETTGSSKTLTVEIIRDSATALTDKEIWLEVDYYGSSGSPLGTLITDAAATVLTSAANQTSSSATWGDQSPSMANPNKQSLSVTFTPNAKGFFIGRVMLAKASTTVYVDPIMTVT